MAKNPREQPHQGIDHDGRSRLTARQHKITHRPLLVDQLVEHALINAFIAATYDNEPAPGGQIGQHGLGQRFSLRAQVPHRHICSIASCRYYGPGKRLGAHDHARPAAIRTVINAFVNPGGEFARIEAVQAYTAVFDGTAGQPKLVEAVKPVGKQGDNINPLKHAQSGPAHSDGQSTVTRRASRSTSTTNRPVTKGISTTSSAPSISITS